jgi:hypothetical protein
MRLAHVRRNPMENIAVRPAKEPARQSKSIVTVGTRAVRGISELLPQKGTKDTKSER